MDQLKTLGEQLNVPVYEKGTSQSAESIVEEAMTFARDHNNDVIIIDTAGRLHIDEPLITSWLILKRSLIQVKFY